MHGAFVGVQETGFALSALGLSPVASGGNTGVSG